MSDPPQTIHLQSSQEMIPATTGEPEPDPFVADSPLESQSQILRESQEYVNIEAYAIAKCAQKALRASIDLDHSEP